MRCSWIWRSALAIVAIAMLLAGESAAQGGPAAVKRIGVAFFRVPLSELTGNPPANSAARYFHQGLRDLGWVEGKNLEILWRSAGADHQRAVADAHELAGAKVDVLVLTSSAANEAAKAIRTTPIVILRASEFTGLIASMATPGGNVTGLFEDPSLFYAKRLDILKQAVPGASRIAVLLDPEVTLGVDELGAATRLGVTLLPYAVNSAAQLNAAVADAKGKGVQALLVETSFGAGREEQNAYRAVVERHRLPAIFKFCNVVTGGAGLICYSLDASEHYRRAAVYVDKILRGASPATLPVEQPMTMRLTINLKAAKAIGFTFPAAMLSRADEVLE